MVSRRTAFVHLPDRATVAITPTRPLLGQARAPLPEAALAACYARLGPPICTADQSSLWPSVLRRNGLFWM